MSPGSELSSLGRKLLRGSREELRKNACTWANSCGHSVCCCGLQERELRQTLKVGNLGCNVTRMSRV